MQLFMQRAGFYCKQIVLIFRQLYLLVYKDATLKDRRAKGGGSQTEAAVSLEIMCRIKGSQGQTEIMLS